MQVAMSSSSHLHPLSKAELRKSNKPIMERKRRARINQCLDELKSLILEAMKKDPARHSKLEKADILEMTVEHLQDVQRSQMRTAVAADPTVLAKFSTGFGECAQEVTRYVSSIEGVDEGVKRRLLGHLTGCMTGLNQVLPLAGMNPGDVNNNMGAAGRLQMLASISPMFSPPSPPPAAGLPITSTPQHRSAFTAVQQRLTPPSSPVMSDSSSDSSCELTVQIAEPRPLPQGACRPGDRLLMEVPRPSPPSRPHSQTVDMWRPW